MWLYPAWFRYKPITLTGDCPLVSEEILINVTPRETRVALVENGMLQEVYIERARRRGYVGNIYKGRVSRVMPGGRPPTVKAVTGAPATRATGIW